MTKSHKKGGVSMTQSATLTRSALSRHRGDYGFDAPYVPITLGSISLVFLSGGVLLMWLLAFPILGTICLIYGIFFLISTGSYLYGTRRGKFEVWAHILSQLGLRGYEQVLDIGCGRGALLLMIARLLPEGKAIGVDLWKTSDQSGNALSVTEQNARLEGVAEQVKLYTADMRDLPFASDTFDVIVSSLAIHNIKEAEGREQAIKEAVRVLKPNGKLLIADFRSTRQYVQCLRELGMADVAHRQLGWRFWYGGPWASTKLGSASKPA